MEIVIDLPKRLIDYMNRPEYDEHLEYEFETIIRYAVMEGTPLPKGHGRLIDADDVNNHIVEFVDLSSCPTIVEADTESEEE